MRRECDEELGEENHEAIIKARYSYYDCSSDS